jgi:uncharacterized protein (DUF2249 family)
MSNNTITVDVREDIRAGREPFSKIMRVVSRLQADERLLLLAPFQPEPLYHVLTKHGFRYQATRTATGDWEVLFTRDDQNGSKPCGSRREDASLGDGLAGAKADLSLLTSAPPETLTVDARGLEPPQPLVTILEALGTLFEGSDLLAHTDRRPMHLYAQLEVRGFTGESQEQADGSFITHIRRR